MANEIPAYAVWFGLSVAAADQATACGDAARADLLWPLSLRMRSAHW
jgi:hypothetical protein